MMTERPPDLKQSMDHVFEELADFRKQLAQQRRADFLRDYATIGTADLARLFDVNEQTVCRWRMADIGPPWIKVGGMVRYRLAELEQWMREQSSNGKE